MPLATVPVNLLSMPQSESRAPRRTHRMVQARRGSDTTVAVRIILHYPSLSLDAAHVRRYRPDPRWRALPASKRPDFGTCLTKARRDGWLLAADPRIFGQRVEEFLEARRRARAAGVRIVVAAELDGERIQRLLQQPRLARLIQRAVWQRELHIYPVSAAFDPALWGRHSSLAGARRAELYLAARPMAEDLAHELLHLELHRQGFPVFAGHPLWTCTLLDIEVDRRTTEAGLDAAASTDRHLTTKMRETLSGDELLREYVLHRMLTTHQTAMRDRFLEGLRQCDGHLALLGDRIVRACRGGEALRSPADAHIAFTTVARLLQAEGIATFRVIVPIESVRDRRSRISTAATPTETSSPSVGVRTVTWGGPLVDRCGHGRAATATSAPESLTREVRRIVPMQHTRRVRDP
jgi:hypothetical protein